MNTKNNKLLIIIGFILLIICIILFYNNRNMRSQLDQEGAENLLSVFRLGGKSDNWKINDGVLINTSNHVYLRIESITYIGDKYYSLENMSIRLQFRDKNTGQKEKHTTGYRYNSEELKDFKTGRVGVSYPREMMEYSKHNIVVEIKYDDENGNPILEEIEAMPVWSFEEQ
ncbi:MAG: hypothetical protein FH751_10000 [Firmicutes bacterium]|nr:hypothetical protein [Bacillota bacterium]